ncbi:rab-GTPase-TBC domain-containing protein [Lasiosphaeria miniovina]|uniref:Rab-GTPase-TBC domain-containing protein n=1 Tax=Lasiosphaeria miniovina TaxID=1954250 RepID=A0AA40BIK1_9PEZI|nr:rab-GTPase-TBC domain-containing protein [Lasiosphaeria miniovina]KAK0734863.1 rab-GTPase-TBC domain-containing protein [Lasiosphaeria miniovina]
MTLRELNHQSDKMSSPSKEAAIHMAPALAPAPPGPGPNLNLNLNLPSTMQLHPPPSPGTHRTLRRLQSAHSLGAKAANQPSLISQQRLQQQQLQFHQYQQLQLQQQQQQTQTQTQTQTQQQQQQRPPMIFRELQPALQLQPQLQPPSQPQFLQRDQRDRQFQHLQQQHIQQHNQQHSQQRAASPPRRNASINRSPQRGRANSDAPLTQPPLGLVTVNKRSALSRRSLAADAMSLERLVRDGPPNGDVEGALESTRLKILDQGIKSDNDGMSSLRIYVWLILLNAPVLETDAYLALIHRGASPAYSKIRNDTFRTLTTDPLFRRRVSEASLIRLLNAIAWKLYDAREGRTSGTAMAIMSMARDPSMNNRSRQSLPAEHSNGGSRPGTGHGSTGHSSHAASSPAAKNRARALTLTTEGSETSGVASEPGTYVQGMNVLAAPFLYAARSEAEAFIGFHQLLTRECPGYIRGAMDGVHKGLALVDKVLAIIDPKLSLYLLSKNMSAEIYAFPSVLTLCACTPPLPEVLRLWDFLFAYGPHLNILCIVAQLVMIRAKIMESPSPNKLLRSFPALQADQIKSATIGIIAKIPDDVYAEIVAHAR